MVLPYALNPSLFLTLFQPTLNNKFLEINRLSWSDILLMIEKPMKKGKDLKVFISTRDSVCGECDENLGRRAWIMLHEKKGALCLACADLDHLVFLPSGDAALTRRARKHSKLSAVVLKWISNLDW
jgi:hypothetical protein